MALLVDGKGAEWFTTQTDRFAAKRAGYILHDKVAKLLEFLGSVDCSMTGDAVLAGGATLDALFRFCCFCCFWSIPLVVAQDVIVRKKWLFDIMVSHNKQFG